MSAVRARSAVDGGEPAAGTGRPRISTISPTRSVPSSKARSSRRRCKYWITLSITGSIVLLLGAMLTLPGDHRYRRVGQQPADRLGLGYHQLRVLDRYRPRRHADLGDSVPVPAEVAHVDQPLRRSDDAVRRDVRGHLPAVPHRPSVARVYWLFPIPNTDLNIWQNFRSPLIWDVFAVIDLLHGVAAVLVHRPGSGSGDAARPRHQQDPAGGLRDSEPGLARIGPALAPL